MSDLATALRAAVRRNLGSRSQVSLLFSGGLDSALLACLLHTLLPAPGALELVTVGTPGALDLSQAERAAQLLGIAWEPRSVTAEEVRQASREVLERSLPRRGAADAKSLSGMRLEVQTGLFLALQRARGPSVMCGQGADELFLGYAHFRPLPEARLHLRYQEDLTRLTEEDLPCSVRLATSLGLELLTPYLDPAWRALVKPIPLERRRAGGVPKALLREVAERAGLPSALAQLPKKALQYGSGVHAALAPR